MVVGLAGTLGDIFWDLPPWVVYAPNFDLGCAIYVANPTDMEREYVLIGELSRDGVIITEEALPVFGFAWFKVAPGDFIRLRGALRFSESDVDLTVHLIERETEEATDSVSTRLVSPVAAAFPPEWPTTPGTVAEGVLGMLPFMMFAMMAMVIASTFRREKREVVAPARGELPPERKLLPPGRKLLPPGRKLPPGRRG